MNMIKKLFGFKEQEDYETVLEQLESKIKKTQAELSSNIVRERNVLSNFLAMSLTIYAFLGFTLIYYQSFRLKIAMLVGPVLIWLVRFGLIRFFERQRNIKVELLVALQSQQQLKVEELKKKTSYYLTKGLVERYESPSKPGSTDSPKLNNFTPQPQNGPNTPLFNKKQPFQSKPTPNAASILGTTPQVTNVNQKSIDANTPQKSLKKGILGTNSAVSTPLKLSNPPSRTWVDRVLDAVVGESDGPQHKYALICESCFIHNGLVPPNEYHDAKFKCMACGHFNSKKIISAQSIDYGEPVPLEFRTIPQPQQLQGQILKQPDGFGLDESFPAIDPKVEFSNSRPSSSGADDENEPTDSLDTESDLTQKKLDTDIISENVTESSGTKSPPSLRKKKKKTKSNKREIGVIRKSKISRMEQFKSNYLSKCAEISVEPLTLLVNTFADYDNREKSKVRLNETLDLSGISISIKSCTALAAALTENQFFTKLILADCFLGDDGCIKIANAIKANGTLKYLDLRGNSIRSDGAVAIGQMLKVNTTLEHLFLEWNCLGIWDTGIRGISEALSLNESLQTIDLRNNKIGPQSCASMAACLKHNTTLRRVDLRWNNMGLLGGKAFADLLQWNKSLTEVEVTGNEIPDEILRAISSALDRNRDKWQHQVHSKAHAETLAATIQSLNLSHQEALLAMQTKVSQTSKESDDLSGKLTKASTEIQEMHESYRAVMAKCQRLEEENKKLEDLIIKERTDLHNQLNDRQKESGKERDLRVKIENDFETYISSSKAKYLEMEAKYRKVSLDLEMLQKEKNNFYEEIDQLRDREKKLNELWQEKFERMQLSHHNKMMELQDMKDQEFHEKSKRLQEKVRSMESEIARLEEDNNAQKARFNSEKRHWNEQLDDIEIRVRKEEEIRIKELDHTLKSQASRVIFLEGELDAIQQKNANIRREFEGELKRSSDEKLGMQEELGQLQSQGMRHALELNNLKVKLEEAKVLKQELDSKKRELEEAANYKVQLSHKDAIIAKLRDEIRKRDMELDSKDEENILRMKELQMSINALMTTRARSQAKRESELLEIM